MKKQAYSAQCLQLAVDVSLLISFLSYSTKYELRGLMVLPLGDLHSLAGAGGGWVLSCSVKRIVCVVLNRLVKHGVVLCGIPEWFVVLAQSVVLGHSDMYIEVVSFVPWSSGCSKPRIAFGFWDLYN